VCEEILQAKATIASSNNNWV